MLSNEDIYDMLWLANKNCSRNFMYTSKMISYATDLILKAALSKGAIDNVSVIMIGFKNYINNDLLIIDKSNLGENSNLPIKSISNLI